jgi:hypothetical protein
MIFDIELPFSLNKTKIGNFGSAYDVRIQIQIQEAKKTRIRLHIFLLYWYFIPLFSSDWGFREKFFRKIDEISRKLWHLA